MDIDMSIQINQEDYQMMYSILQEAMDWKPREVSSNSGMDRLTFLQNSLLEMSSELDEIGISIDNVRW